MSRIPSHTLQDAPAAARPLLAEVLKSSPTGRLLNLHAQLAHAPAVLDAYVAIRRANGRLELLDQRTRTALMLAAATATGSEYAMAILSTLASRSGWDGDQIAALLAGQDVGEERSDALIAVVKEAAADSGRVSDETWARAISSGWGGQHLAEAFACLGLAVYTAYFLNYAATEPDVPSPASHGAGVAGG